MTRRSLFKSLAGVVAGTILARMPLAGIKAEAPKPVKPDLKSEIDRLVLKAMDEFPRLHDPRIYMNRATFEELCRMGSSS